jgi:hypothetical protein
MGTSADFFAAFIGGLVGGALVWHFKDFFVAVGRKFVSWFAGAKYLASKAEADVANLTSKLNAAKAAVTAATAAVKS